MPGLSQNRLCRLFRRVRLPVAIVLLALLMVSCAGQASSGDTNALEQTQQHLVALPQGQDVFDPFILPVQPQVTVTWRNEDRIAHAIMTTPEHASYLNPMPFSLTVAPGQAVTYTFTQPGLYHYYDSTVATWDAGYQRVRPNQGVPKYPMAMEGVIWVQGPIAGLPAVAYNHVVHLKDQIAYNFVAVQQGGTVYWHNYDTDAHFFQTVLGYDAPINPVDIGINNLRGSDEAPPDGESKGITFTTPGLYYYFCFTHASVEPVLLRAYAHDDASEYPIPMEGFVLVTDG